MDKRKLALGLLAGAALFMFITAFTKTWWSAGEGRRSISVGPTGIEMCRGGECESMSLDKAARRGSGSTWATMGTFVMVFGAIGGLICGGAAAAVGMRKVIGSGPLALSKNAIGMGSSYLLLSIIFFASVPGDGGKIGVSFGFPLALLAGAAGIAGGLMMKQWEESPDGMAAKAGGAPVAAGGGFPGMPQQPPMGMPGMQQPMGMAPQAPAQVTPCTRCGAPLRWVAEHNRWYCEKEQQYL